MMTPDRTINLMACRLELTEFASTHLAVSILDGLATRFVDDREPCFIRCRARYEHEKAAIVLIGRPYIFASCGNCSAPHDTGSGDLRTAHYQALGAMVAHSAPENFLEIEDDHNASNIFAAADGVEFDLYIMPKGAILVDLSDTEANALLMIPGDHATVLDLLVAGNRRPEAAALFQSAIRATLTNLIGNEGVRSCALIFSEIDPLLDPDLDNADYISEMNAALESILAHASDMDMGLEQDDDPQPAGSSTLIH